MNTTQEITAFEQHYNNVTGSKTSNAHKPLHSRAMCVRLAVQIVERKSQTDKAGTRRIANENEAETESLALVRKFYPTSRDESKDAWGMFSKLTSIHGRFAAYLRFITAPWDNDGWRILPSSKFFSFAQELRKAKEDFQIAADELAVNFEEVLQRAEAARGKLFRRSDYPATREAFRAGMRFQELWLPLPDASHVVVDMVGEAAEEITAMAQRSTQEQLDKAMDTSMRDAFAKLARPLEAMAAKLATPDGVFRDSLIGNVREVLSILPDLNLSGDAALTAFIAEVESKLATCEPQELRDDADVRKQTAQAADDILARMRDYCPSIG